MTEQIKKKCAMLVISNVMCLICSIPVVTAGAAYCALYSIMFRLARNDLNFNIFQEFIRCFKLKLRKTIIPWISILILYGIMLSDIILCYRIQGWVAYMRFPVYILFAILVIIADYLFPLMSRSNLSVKKILLNCIFFVWRRPVKAAFILLVHVIPLYGFITDSFLRILVIIVTLFFGISLVAYITAILLQSEIDILTSSKNKRM